MGVRTKWLLSVDSNTAHDGPPTDDGATKGVCVHTVVHYSATKKEWSSDQATRWMNPEVATPSEIPRHKRTKGTIPQECPVQANSDRKQHGGVREWLLAGTGFACCRKKRVTAPL